MEKEFLEKYIENHRAELDTENLPSDLWQKIESKLDKPKVVDINKRFDFGLFSKIAAAVVFIMAVGVGLGYKMGNTSKESSPMVTEFQKSELYFQQEVNNRMAEIKTVAYKNPNITRDIEELDKVYLDLKAELSTVDQHQSNEVMKQLINNYKLRIALLEKVLSKTKQNTKHSNEDIIY